MEQDLGVKWKELSKEIIAIEQVAMETRNQFHVELFLLGVAQGSRCLMQILNPLGEQQTEDAIRILVEKFRQALKGVS